MTIRRGPYTELPDGSLQCTIVISADQRQSVMSGSSFSLPQIPGKTPETIVERVTDLVQDPDGERIVVNLIDDRVDDSKPLTQTLAPAGDDQSSIMVPGMEDALRDWKHPARYFMPTLFMWSPFQQFALERAGGSTWNAPMPTAVGEIRKAAQSVPGNVIAGLEQMLEQYRVWTVLHKMPAWPG